MIDRVRLIDANALKEDFMNDYHNYMMESLRGNYHDTIRISEVIERIEDAPTIEVKYGKDWISVKDRLPETNVNGIAHILAYDKCEGVIKADFLGESANYINGSNIFEISNTSTQLYKVTHWQPLPKPPKGG